MMMKAEQFVLDAFWGFVTRSLYNLGEDFSSPKKTGETANHEKPPLPLGVLLMIASLIVTGACVAAVFLAIWYYFLGVVPAKMMVLSHNQDEAEELPKPSIWQLRRQISQFRFNLLRPSNREIMEGALYVFFMFNWLSDVVARLFSPGIHRGVVYVLAAMLLCPLQFIATGLSIKFPSLFSPPRGPLTEPSSEKGEKAPSPPTVRKPAPRLPVKQRVRAVLYCYTWLAPTTVIWALAGELVKIPPLALSQTYSLKERVHSMEVLYALSGPSLRALLLDSALVFLVWVTGWLLLILPTTIAMRRTHASLADFSDAVVPPDEAIRGRTDLVEGKFLGAFEALRTVSFRQVARVMVFCGPAYCIMQVIKSVGLGALVLWVKIMEDRYGSTEQYMGFWETLGWFFQRVVFRN